MARMRKLRKAEQAMVDAAVGSAFEKALPHLQAVEGVVAEHLLPSVPRDLVPFAGKDFTEHSWKTDSSPKPNWIRSRTSGDSRDLLSSGAAAPGRARRR